MNKFRQLSIFISFYIHQCGINEKDKRRPDEYVQDPLTCQYFSFITENMAVDDDPTVIVLIIFNWRAECTDQHNTKKVYNKESFFHSLTGLGSQFNDCF
jgi:hypothetical protein